MSSYERTLDNFENTFSEKKSEVKQLKEAYYFEDSDLEKYMSLDKMLTQLREQLKGFVEKVSKNSHAHTKLRAELEEAFQQLEKIEKEHEEFKLVIQNLRKDELEAKEQLQVMSDEIHKITRKLRNSNLPGVPNYIWILLEEAAHKNDQVLNALHQ